MWNGHYTFHIDTKVIDLNLDALMAGPVWG
jgi:hypothetical protein